MRTKTHLSLRMKTVLLFSIIVTPLFVLLIFVNDYAIRLLKAQETEANQNMLQISLSQIEDALSEKKKYLMNLAFFNSSVITLGLNGEENSLYHYAKSDLKYTLMEGLGSDQWVDGYFVYLKDNQEFVTTALNVNNYEERMRVFDDLERTIAAMEADVADTGWHSAVIAGNLRLVSVIRSLDNVYVAVIINVNKMKEIEKLLQLAATDEIIALSNSGEVLTNHTLSPEWIEILRQAIEERRNYVETRMQSDKYLLFTERSELAGMTIVKKLPEQHLLRHMSQVQRIIQVIPFGILIVLLVIIVMFRQVVLKPIHILLKGMRKIKEGQWDYRLEAGANKEFILINDTFNEMVKQINALKIDVYEEQLKGQSTEIQRLQLQIHPHFLLNSLNMVYNLAQQKNYTLIQKMTKHLMDYFRFMLSSPTGMLKISDEMAHIEHYLEIQKMRFAGHLSYRIGIGTGTLEVEVPPLIFQPFVENTIIHGLTMGNDRFQVSILINRLYVSEREWLEIIIADNGQGFSPPILARLQQNEEVRSKSNRVGIQNVKDRLQLHYKHHATLTFANVEPRGAMVRIMLPINEIE